METTRNIKVRPSRRLGLALAALAFLPLLLLQPAAAQTTYTVTDLGTLGGTFSIGINNNRGAYSGASTLAGDTVQHAFLWTGGSLVDLGSLPAGPNSGAINANERLQVAGSADGAATTHDGNACYCTNDLNSNLNCHAVVWQNGTISDLGTMGGNSSLGEWINNSGQTVGISQINAIDPNGFIPCGSRPGNQINRAFLFENGKFEDLGTLGGFSAAATIINDAGQIAGASDTTTTIDPTLGFVPHHAYLWTNGVMKDLGTLGGGLSIAFALNAKGAVAGFSTLTGEQHTHAFLWQSGAITDLGVVAGDTDSGALGGNGFGQVVGFSATSKSMRAFLWQNGVITDLNTLINPDSGFQLAIAEWINDAGEIAAQALVESTGEFHAVLLTPSNNGIRGNPGGAPLTPTLRSSLKRKLGLARMKFLK